MQNGSDWRNELLVKCMEEREMSVTELAYCLGIREHTAYSWTRPAVEKRRRINKRVYLLAMSKIFKNNDFLLKEKPGEVVVAENIVQQ